jgi:hypothetical protein
MDLDEHETVGRWGEHFVRNVGDLFGKDLTGLVGVGAVHENSQGSECRINKEDQPGRSQRDIVGKEQKSMIEDKVMKMLIDEYLANTNDISLTLFCI